MHGDVQDQISAKIHYRHMDDVYRIGRLAQITQNVAGFVQVGITKTEHPKNPAIGFQGHQVFGRLQVEGCIA